MARDRPSPYREGSRSSTKKPSCYRSAGPVPRDCPVDRSMAKDRPSLYGEGGRFSTKNPSRYRSAGACPPRLSGRPQHGEGQALALRGRGPFFDKKPSGYRSAGALGCHTRIRAGFPRDCPVDRSMARDRPSPYAEGAVFRLRNLPVTVARGPVPRDVGRFMNPPLN